MLPRIRPVAPALLLLAHAVLGCSSGDGPRSSAGAGGGSTSTSAATTTTGAGAGPSVEDIMGSLPESCSFVCGGVCNEPDTPFDCPTVKPWQTLPHDPACGTWDGTYPAPVAGKCTASVPTGAAAITAGALPGGGLVLPDGHRIQPAGVEWVFQEADLHGGYPMSILPLAGTHYALVSDGGIQDNALRLVDVDALAAGSDPVAAYTPFHEPTSLFYGMAFLPPSGALASGGGDGNVYAFDVDTTAGALSRAPSRDIPVGAGDDGSPYYIGPIALTGDGTKLLVAPSDHATDIRVFSLAAGTYGQKIASIPVGSKAIFDLRLDPDDPAGNTFYASDQGQTQLIEIDAAAASVTRTVPLQKNPAQIVFLDATFMAVTEEDNDSIAVVDRVAGAVAADVPVFAAGAPHGFSPSALAYDPASGNLYATFAGINAVGVFAVTPGTPPAPPTIAPAGSIPAAWWPTGVMVAADGGLVLVNGKGHGTGTNDMQYTWGQGPITTLMHGSVQYVPPASLSDLTTSTAVVDQGHLLGGLQGAAAISCPAGAAYDFPVPTLDTTGPSQQIKHVLLVVRENKTYDALFGDRPDLGDGDPALIMASTPALEAQIWQNTRAIAQGFTNFDNFYTDAEQSIQGHTWTVYGRTTDYMERTWLSIWGRATRDVADPTEAIDAPQEGGIFTWMTDNQVSVEDMGEVIGNFLLDTGYPGLVYAAGRPDVDKSCYVAGRARLRCDLPSFTYIVQPDDHTFGAQAGEPAPEVMIADNDEASGLLLDALSHSPMWQDTLLIITEDDPQDGGDHIDQHRSVLMMASPWVKRGYVSHGHYDMASVYKLVAHIFGVPYHNDMIENALAPFDAFTSTPDFTPYTYLPRKVAAPCNPSGTPGAREAERWDFDDLDDQPGLSQQIMRMMREPPAERGIRSLP
jgi:DNA-binding beta-propeller fold protein YncE